MELELLRDLGIALGMGLIVGLQREWSDSKIAGVRTFPLIALFGALCGVIGTRTGGLWVVAAGVVAVASAMWAGNRLLAARHAEDHQVDPGMTTEMAALVMYCVGAFVTLGYQVPAIVVAGVTAALLQWKKPLHGLVRRIGAEDLRAVVRFVVIGMVILPVLPNRPYGPFGVLNPFHIWLMVVLIVGISLLAYLGRRLLGPGVGSIAAGLLGGLISSTATAFAAARDSQHRDAVSDAAATVILLSSTVVFVRVGAEVAVVAPEFLAGVAPPLAVLGGVLAACSVVAALQARRAPAVSEAHADPAQLGAAIAFGLLYAAVLLAVAAATHWWGSAGTYLVAGISGLTDVDAITLSTAKLMQADGLAVSTGWRLIVVGTLSNLGFKAGVVWVLGSRTLARRVLPMFGVVGVVGVLVIALWPG